MTASTAIKWHKQAIYCGNKLLYPRTYNDAAKMTSPRRSPPPWQVEQIPGGFNVRDANGQALVYVYARETREQADIAKVLTLDEALRIAVNVAKLPKLLGATSD